MLVALTHVIVSFHSLEIKLFVTGHRPTTTLSLQSRDKKALKMKQNTRQINMLPRYFN